MRLSTVLQWILPENEVMWPFAADATSTSNRMLVPPADDAAWKEFEDALLNWESGPHITLLRSKVAKYNGEKREFRLHEPWDVQHPHEVEEDGLDSSAEWYWVMLRVRSEPKDFVRGKTKHPPPHISIAWVQLKKHSMKHSV